MRPHFSLVEDASDGIDGPNEGCFCVVVGAKA